MSAWVDGKLDLKCSLDLLKRALSNLMPEWAAHIKTDPSGKLSMYRWKLASHDPEKRRRKDMTVHIIIPGSGNPNFPTPPGRDSDNDWGFTIGADGKWETRFADHQRGVAEGLANSAVAEISKMKHMAAAKMKGYKLTKNVKEKNKLTLEFQKVEV